LNSKKEKNYINLTSRIKNNYKKFSEGQKLIATYLLKHSDKATFFTAANLGRVVGVSESTVVRFADFLGYEGYPALQKDLQNRIKNKLNTVSRLKRSIKIANSGESILYEVFRNDIDNIQKTMDNISRESLSELEEIWEKYKVFY
jgi:DNA-binding MurR/RpiR family transcriptional regulator